VGITDLSVIIVSFNSAGWLRPCLKSVFAHAGTCSLGVVVVDNASTDGSAELVEREFPAVRVLRNQNRGFAHANNRGFEITDAPYTLFLNPDTEIRSGTFSDLVDALRVRPSVGLVGCRQLTSDGTLYPTIRRFPTPVRQLCEALGSERLPVRPSWTGQRELDPAAYDRETRCDWVSGSFMLARRAAVVQAGLWDERYFLYCEEIDLCAAITAAGWEVRYLPEMTFVHHDSKTGHNPRLVAQEAYASRQYFHKHEGPVRRKLSAATLSVFYARRSLAPVGHDSDARKERIAARAGLRTLLGAAPAPFGELSGPVNGARRN
jgi:N-acetylglucosaminyl-diphospho-decaprenol L-rhamnosyltransferase